MPKHDEGTLNLHPEAGKRFRACLIRALLAFLFSTRAYKVSDLIEADAKL